MHPSAQRSVNNPDLFSRIISGVWYNGVPTNVPLYFRFLFLRTFPKNELVPSELFDF